MSYIFTQIENGDWVIVNADTNATLFILSQEQDAEGNFVRGLPEHVQMIQDFQDTSKLEYFIQLLIDNPGTAFITYLGLNLGS